MYAKNEEDKNVSPNKLFMWLLNSVICSLQRSFSLVKFVNNFSLLSTFCFTCSISFLILLDSIID